MKGIVEDLKGQRFGRLTVGVLAGRQPTRWSCLCDCGNSCEVWAANLKRGMTQSCGCLQAERTGDAVRKHGQAGTSTYRAWQALRDRCYNPNNPNYNDYGGRGIAVCAQWTSFENFLADMGERPKGKSLDRVDNNKGYSPENCRWATQTEQTNNCRSNRRIEWRGETKTVAEWSRVLSIKAPTLYARLYKGWSVEEALTGIRKKKDDNH